MRKEYIVLILLMITDQNRQEGDKVPKPPTGQLALRGIIEESCLQLGRPVYPSDIEEVIQSKKINDVALSSLRRLLAKALRAGYVKQDEAGGYLVPSGKHGDELIPVVLEKHKKMILDTPPPELQQIFSSARLVHTPNWVDSESSTVKETEQEPSCFSIDLGVLGYHCKGQIVFSLWLSRKRRISPETLTISWELRGCVSPAPPEWRFEFINVVTGSTLQAIFYDTSQNKEMKLQRPQLEFSPTETPIHFRCYPTQTPAEVKMMTDKTIRLGSVSTATTPSRLLSAKGSASNYGVEVTVKNVGSDAVSIFAERGPLIRPGRISEMLVDGSEPPINVRPGKDSTIIVDGGPKLVERSSATKEEKDMIIA